MKSQQNLIELVTKLAINQVLDPRNKDLASKLSAAVTDAAAPKVTAGALQHLRDSLEAVNSNFQVLVCSTSVSQFRRRLFF